MKGCNLRTLNFDLHTHTNHSPKCGFMRPEQLVKKAIVCGLDGIAVTDHNTIKGALKAKHFENNDFKVIVGCEVTTNAGEIMGIFLEQEIESSDPVEVIEEIHDQGGLAIIPHPFDKFRSSRFVDIEQIINMVDGLEVFNSRCIKKESNDIARQYAINIQRKQSLSMVGGSDAHFPGEVGNAYTEISCLSEDKDWSSLLKTAILTQQTAVFGKRSSLMNHVGTKLLKWRRRNVTCC